MPPIAWGVGTAPYRPACPPSRWARRRRRPRQGSPIEPDHPGRGPRRGRALALGRHPAPGQVRQPAREPLSQRELDILGLIAQGCSNREAAVRLFISEATVKTHVLHIYAKLGVNDRAAAVATGFERGLLPRS